MNDIKVKLEDVCERGSSNLAQKDLENLTGDYPVYGAGGYVKDIDFYHQENEYIAVVKDGAGIGRTVFLPGKSSVIGTLQYLVPKDNIVPKYLYYAVTSMKLEKYYTGATIPHIYFKDYKKEVLPLPNKNIQLEIVSILEKAEKIISYRKQQIDALDNLIKSRFVEMFGDPKSNPMNWDKGTIRDIVTEVKYGTSKPAVEGGKYKYLRMNNITFEGELDLSSLKYIDIPENEYEKCVVRKGDVMFNRTNSKELVGKTCVFNQDEEMIIAGYIIRVRTNEKALPEYLSALLNSKYGKETLYGMCKAIVGQANINAQELQDIGIIIPPVAFQQTFVAFKEQVDKLKVKVQKSLEETQILFDSLMQKYFE